MRLSENLRQELDARLKTISTEQPTDPAFKNISTSDATVIAALLLGAILISEIMILAG